MSIRSYFESKKTRIDFDKRCVYNGKSKEGFDGLIT